MEECLILASITDYLSAAHIFDWVVNNAGYGLVFALMVVESSFIPFPSEVVVPPVAFLAYTRGDLNVFLVVLVATAGALVGALINYYLSMWIGRPLVYRFADSRIGHACLLDRAKVEKAERYFDRHGAVSTLMGRLIPAVRQLISVPAGLARMNIVKFIVFTSIGAGIWNTILGALGYWLATQYSINQLYEQVERYNSYLTYAGLAIGALCVAFIVWNAFKKNKNSTPDTL